MTFRSNPAHRGCSIGVRETQENANGMNGSIPVVLFVYRRSTHLARAMVCLKENRVELLYVFADGPKGEGDASAVAEVRALVRAIDWCEVRLVERSENFGLGRNVISGVTEVAARHEAFIVWEDDLVCVPGTYAWMCAALRHYADDERVFSVTGWTHPRVTPADVGATPYFDARAESWTWGGWSRSWRGMSEETALEKIAALKKSGGDPSGIGADLPGQAEDELRRNLWAVRWLYHHLLHDGLCVRPPWSMVDHRGFDALATNAPIASGWDHGVLRCAPPLPAHWPVPRENPECRRKWQAAYPTRGKARLQRLLTKMFGR